VRWRLATLGHAVRPVLHPLRTVRRAAEFVAQLRALWSRNRGNVRTSLNQPLGRARRLAVLDVSLAAVKAAGHSSGATVNDVLLAAIGGGFRALLAARNEILSGPLHASEGVSLRRADDASAGNQAGGMLVPLHADVSDPVERLRCITEDTRALKAERGAPAVVGILDSPWLPAAVTAFFERRLRSQTLVQTYVANVPGPTQPLQVLGTPLRQLIPIVPLMGNVTVVVAAASYVDRLVIGVRSDAEAAPDIGVFVRGMQSTLNSLVDSQPGGQPANSRPIPRASSHRDQPM
jgi:diacylglycerol O-acyltransferase / wax synthase